MPPTPPATGNGGFLPGLPNTGAGGMVATDTAASPATVPATSDNAALLGLAMIVIACAVTFGMVRRRAPRP